MNTLINSKKYTILIVDDTPDNLSLLSALLKDLYKTKIAINGEKALKIATAETPPDLILLDIMMPEIDGYEVCRQLKENPQTAEIPVIFLTAKSQVEDEQKGFELGAVDYITKPISPPILMSRVHNHLMLKEARDILKNQNEILEEKVQKRTEELSIIKDVTILAMASLAETRDNETGNHIRRTQNYVKALAVQLKNHPNFCELLTPENIESLYKSAPLHDIGKVGIPDYILLKPGRLSPEEFEIMKKHAQYGSESIESAENKVNASQSFLTFAKEIAHYHHEKWDGSGYPKGLQGVDIPTSARLMAVADVYDALISKRCYKPAFTHETAVDLIIKGSGNHFDPEIVDAFCKIAEEFRQISINYADNH